MRNVVVFAIILSIIIAGLVIMLITIEPDSTGFALYLGFALGINVWFWYAVIHFVVKLW